MPRCLLALGANLGNRTATLQNALREIAALPHTSLLARSIWHETPAVGGPAGQGNFLNGAVLIDTELVPQELATRLQAIEIQQGREHKVRWAARTLDIDLLIYGGEIVDTPELTIPHPRMSFRRFVLVPVAEIAGPMVVPSSGWTIASLLTHLSTAARYVAISSADLRTADWLAGQLCQRLNAPRLEDFIAKTQAEDDAHGLSAVEWEKHEELRKRLPLLENNNPDNISPVFSGYGLQPAVTGSRAGFVLPALAIDIAPPMGVSLDEKFQIHGPQLNLDGNDLDRSIAEALAAIRAVWPD